LYSVTSIMSETTVEATKVLIVASTPLFVVLQIRFRVQQKVQ
jgi:hypothetical protein